jgi:hypothetical protein
MEKFLFIRQDDKAAAGWERVCLRLLEYPSLATRQPRSKRKTWRTLRQITTHLSRVQGLLSILGYERTLIDFEHCGEFETVLQRYLVGTRDLEALYKRLLVRKERTPQVSATLIFLHHVHFLLEKRQFDLRRDGSVYARKIKPGFTRGGFLAVFAAELWNCAKETEVQADFFNYTIDVAAKQYKSSPARLRPLPQRQKR